MKEIVEATFDIATDGEPSASLLKEVVMWGANKFEEKRNKAINNFYSNLLNGEVTEEKINYEKEHIQANEEQYYALLNIVINEEEQEKTFIYANVYKYIRDHQELEKKEKLKLIRLAKSLPYSVLELIPHIYIYENFPTQKTLDSFLKEIRTKDQYEINLLIQANIIEETIQDGKAGVFVEDVIKLIDSSYFIEIAKAFFTEEKLCPKIYDINTIS